MHPGKPVAAGAFEKLLQGHVIGTKLRLGRLRDGQHKHRPGFDITFSAPKSVSLAALLPTEKHPHGERAVIRAHNAAVRETLDWIEATLLETRGWDPATRRRPRVKAPWMVAALFRHIASRNLDPQLHTHAVTANMTRDKGGRWKSVEPMLLHRNARLIGAYYRDRLVRQLIDSQAHRRLNKAMNDRYGVKRAVRYVPNDTTRARAAKIILQRPYRSGEWDAANNVAFHAHIR